MSGLDSLIDIVTDRSGAVIAVLLVLSVAIGAGAANVEESTSFEQFEFETDEGDALTYVNENFAVTENETTVQIVYRDDNTLSREGLIRTLELQTDFEGNDTVNETLAADGFGDLSAIVATAAIRSDRADEIERRSEALENDSAAIERRAGNLSDYLNETAELQVEYEELNGSFQRGEIDEETYADESDRIESDLEDIRESAREAVTDEQFAEFEPLLAEMRSLQSDAASIDADFQRGEIDEETRDERIESVESDIESLYEAIDERVLADEIAALENRADRIEADADALEDLDPSTDEQIEQLESMTDSEVEAIVETILAADADRDVFVFLPTDYEPGSTTVDARTLFVTQETTEQLVEGEAPDRIVDAQLAMNDLVTERLGEDSFAFGVGVITDETERSLTDSVAIVLPLALLLVIGVLVVAYRDGLDILLGAIGIVLTLVWTFGFMGWTGIDFNIMMIAVPVLLVGLSVDYAIHVLMRHREQRTFGTDDTGSRRSMAIALSGIGVALGWVTITAVFGFLSNLVSPVAPMREFGIVSAFGLAATLLLFGMFVPALKVELDERLEARGIDRRKRAFGTGGGVFTRFLSGGASIARSAPWAVVLVVMVLTAGGAYGATQVDTTFEQEDFIADDPPAWMDSLPEPFTPGEYAVKSQLDFVNDRFLRDDTQTQVLVRGDVTADDTIERLDTARGMAADQPSVVVLSGGDADVRDPRSVMDEVAASNETFEATFTAADTNGDGVPDENVTAVYDALYDADPDRAGEFLHRTEDGEYEALRVVVSMQGDATSDAIAEETDAIGDSLDGDGLTATSTGQRIVFGVIETQLFDTVLESLVVSLVAVFGFLMVAYRRVHRSALLGGITLLPIALVAAWILGVMYLLEIPFNVVTGTITSLTIGLGIAYNIHMTERYMLELDRGRSMRDALYLSVTGTGGALLGSAATTIGGFGVLLFAILPPLQQFGLISALMIGFAFLASVFVLPSFLSIWTRHLAGEAVVDAPPADEPAAVETVDWTDDPTPDADAERSNVAVESVPTADTRPATRTITPTYLACGQQFAARIDVPNVVGRVVVQERHPIDNVVVEAISPDPIDVVATDRLLAVAWEVSEPTDVSFSYRGTVPAAATDGTTFEVEGELLVSNGSRSIEGDTSLTVVDDIFERILAQGGRMTVQDLHAASDALEAGELTHDQYRRICREWLRPAVGETDAERPSGAIDADREQNTDTDRPEGPGDRMPDRSTPERDRSIRRSQQEPRED
ncbi:MAG: MMPL family transporter [Halobacteriota archaeon]